MGAEAAAGKVRAGLGFSLRWSRERKYLRQAAGILSRELNLPPDRVEGSVHRAYRWARWQSPRVRVERWLLGSHRGFDALMEATGGELARILRRDFPDTKLLPGDERVAELWQQALRSVVAGTSDDGLAEKILEEHGSVIGTRREWKVLTASIAGASVAGLAAGLGVETSHRPAAAVVAGLIAAALAGTAAAGAFGRLEGAAVHEAHDALRDFVLALRARSGPEDPPPTPTQELHGIAVRPMLSWDLERIVSAGDSEPSGASRAPPEVLYRWDGKARERLWESVMRLGRALRKLQPRPGWNAPTCITHRLEAIFEALPVADRDPWEAEVRAGEDLFHLLVCCAAVASVLDKALGLEDQPRAA
jgi:hypothetical protein